MAPLEIWQSKVASYLSLASVLEDRGQKAVFVSFEDLVTDQLGTLFRLREVLGGFPREPKVILESTKSSNLKSSDYARYYREERWRRSFEVGEISRLLGRLDEKILGTFNYENE